MEYLEKIKDLREVIAMLLEINKKLIERTKMLLDDKEYLLGDYEYLKGKLQEKDEEIDSLKEINRDFSEKLEKISTDVQNLKNSNGQLDRRIYDEASKICKKTDEVVTEKTTEIYQKVQGISEEIVGLRQTLSYEKETQEVFVPQETETLESHVEEVKPEQDSIEKSKGDCETEDDLPWTPPEKSEEYGQPVFPGSNEPEEQEKEQLKSDVAVPDEKSAKNLMDVQNNGSNTNSSNSQVFFT